MKPLLIPLFAALIEPANVIISKVGLTRMRIQVRDFIPGAFLFLTICSTISLVKLGHFSSFNLTNTGILKLILIIIIAASWNVLYYTGLSKEKVNTAEGIIILMPLATIAMSWLFNPQYFDIRIAITASVATSIIMWTHRSKQIFRPDKYALMLSVAVVLIALENNLVSQLLRENSISPALLYTIRVFFIFLIMYIHYRPSLLRLSHKNILALFVAGVVGTSSMLLLYYGLLGSGVVSTALVFILVPIFVLISAVVFLHERIKPGQILAMTIVCGLVAYAILTSRAN